MKKYLLPLLGLALLSATVLSARRGEVNRHQAGATERPQSKVAPVSRSGRIAAEGRVVAYPGAVVVVSTDFAGTLTRMAVHEKDPVRKGDLLAELNADLEKASLDEARARVAEADADIRLATSEEKRAEKLLAAKVGTQQALDRTRRDIEAASARRVSAAAEQKRLAVQVAKARIVAPLDGVVLLRHAQPGETVDRRANLFTIANLERLRVEAEVDESDSGRIVLGAPVSIRAEGDEAHPYPGRIEEIPDAVGSRQLKPQDPGRPSDTRVLLVKITFDGRTPLKLGRRVELEIDGARTEGKQKDD